MFDLDKRKRVIYISAGILILLIFGFIVWRWILPIFGVGSGGSTPGGQTIGGINPPGFPTPTPGGTPVPSGSIFTPPPPPPGPPEEQKLLRLTDFPVIGPSLNTTEDRILFYKKEGGDLFSSDFQGRTQEKISNITIIGFIEAVWSPLRDRAVLSYIDQETLKSFLHIGTSTVGVLPQGVRNASWSPDGRSLAYTLVKDGRLNVVITDSTGRTPRTILSTPLPDATIDWASQDRIALITAPSGLAEGFLFALPRTGGRLEPILGPRFGLTARWSPKGTRFLAASTNGSGQQGKFAVFDANGKEVRQISFYTIPEKCRWVNEAEVLCAIPNNVPQGSIWPDDYLRGELSGPDSLLRFNTETGSTTPIFGVNEGKYSISDINATKDGKVVFFVSRTDGTLWRLKAE